MRCLLLYYSLTDQAARAVESAAQTCHSAGWDAVICRIDFANPADAPRRPFSIADSKRWVDAAQQGKIFPLSYTPAAALDADYDLVLLFTNTWGMHPSVPIRSFLDSPEAKRVLAGKPFGVYVICRRLWEKNLALVREKAEAAGGRYIGGEGFVHPGSNVGSLIQTVTYIHRAGSGLRHLLGFPLPPYGLSDESLAKVPVFTRSLLSGAS
jgi:hypothetical protein